MHMHSNIIRNGPRSKSTWLTLNSFCAGKPKHDPKPKHEHKGHYGKPKHAKGHYGHAKPAKHEHKGHYGVSLPVLVVDLCLESMQSR